MIIASATVGIFQENCYIIGEKPGGDAVVIDPGDEIERIMEALTNHSLCCRFILHTHAHVDHCAATPDLQKATNAACLVPQKERELWEALPQQAQIFGVKIAAMPPVDRWLKDGDTIDWGDTMSLQVIETPGHSPGGVTYQLKRPDEKDLLFVGDALFCGSIGRTDLMGGNFEQLISSIKNRLLNLPDDSIVLCGHGPLTTIGQEKQYNPFL